MVLRVLYIKSMVTCSSQMSAPPGGVDTIVRRLLDRFEDAPCSYTAALGKRRGAHYREVLGSGLPKCAGVSRAAPPGPPRPSSEVSEIAWREVSIFSRRPSGLCVRFPLFDRPDQCAVRGRPATCLRLSTISYIGSGEPPRRVARNRGVL